jgi:hypothetical protein
MKDEKNNPPISDSEDPKVLDFIEETNKKNDDARIKLRLSTADNQTKTNGSNGFRYGLEETRHTKPGEGLGPSYNGPGYTNLKSQFERPHGSSSDDDGPNQPPGSRGPERRTSSSKKRRIAVIAMILAGVSVISFNIGNSHGQKATEAKYVDYIPKAEAEAEAIEREKAASEKAIDEYIEQQNLEEKQSELINAMDDFLTEGRNPLPGGDEPGVAESPEK